MGEKRHTGRSGTTSPANLGCVMAVLRSFGKNKTDLPCRREVSGDSMASRLMASLKLLSPFPVRFTGIGQAKMTSEGLQSLFPIEVRLNKAIEAAALFEPHVVLTVQMQRQIHPQMQQYIDSHNLAFQQQQQQQQQGLFIFEF